jgi:hypothetical protein
LADALASPRKTRDYRALHCWEVAMVWLKRVLTCHWTVSLLMMGLFGAVFSLSLLNLITLLNANLRLIARHGEHVLFEGALQQLAELTALGYVAVIAYVLFKVCECALVQRILREPESRAPGESAPAAAVTSDPPPASTAAA